MVQKTEEDGREIGVAAELLNEYRAILARLESEPLTAEVLRARALLQLWHRVLVTDMDRTPDLRSIWWEAFVWDLQRKAATPGHRRGAHWQPMTESADGATYPDLGSVPDRDDFTAYLAQRLQETSAPVHRARYADVLWEMDGGFQRAYTAAEAYLAVLPLLKAAPFYRRRDAITRALDLGLQLQNAELVAAGKQALLTELKLRQPDGHLYDGLELLPWLVGLPDHFVERAGLTEGHLYAEEAATALQGGGEAGLFRARFAFQLVARFARRLRDGPGEQRALLALGAAIEMQAAQAAGRSRTVEAGLLRQAFTHYANHGFTEQADQVRRRLEQAQQEALPEFKTFSRSAELDTEAIDRMASALAELPPVQSLAFVATRPDWHPAMAEMESLAADVERQNPLLRAMARARHSYDGRLIAVSESEEERRRAQVFDLYLLWVQMRGVVLARLYGRMAEGQRWTADSITDFLASGVAFDADKLTLLRTGIERYFARDYVSSLHVLVPLFEDVLRRLRGKLGLNTTSVKPGSGLSRQVRLEEVLATPPLIEGLGSDAIDYLRFLFVEQQGLNLRNEIAHGLLPQGWMREPLVALVIDALLHLQPLYLTPTKEAVEQEPSERAGVLAVGIESQEGFGGPSISTSAARTNLPDAAWIREMNDRIVHDFHPLRVILFGSHARGEAGPDSDVDLLVVLPAVEDRRQAAAEIRKALGGIRLPKDIVVTDPEDIVKRGDLPGTVLYSALREGRVLYDRE